MEIWYFMNYSLYVCDTETTGLLDVHDVIELSLIRLSDNVQKTWFIKPINMASIDMDALRINGHKLEDLNHETKYGRDTYKNPSDIIIEVENWLMEDDLPKENRVMVAQNCAFDKRMLEQLWIKCNSNDSFPFGRRTLDTMQIEFFLNWCQNKMLEGYSLSNITKKYGIKNDKAHSAASDTKATKEVFQKQVDFFKNVLK